MSCFLNIIFIKYIDLECSTLLLLLQWLHLINYCKFSLAIFIFLLFFLYKRYLETFSIDIRVKFSPMIKELDSNEFTSLAFFNRSRFDFGQLTCAQDTEFNQWNIWSETPINSCVSKIMKIQVRIGTAFVSTAQSVELQFPGTKFLQDDALWISGFCKFH